MSADPRNNEIPPGDRIDQGLHPIAELVIRSTLETLALTQASKARGYIATQCLVGLLSSSRSAMDPSGDQLRVGRAVQLADALIAALNERREKGGR